MMLFRHWKFPASLGDPGISRPPTYTKLTDDQRRPCPPEPYDRVADEVRAVDAILRRCAISACRSWKRIDELLDARLELRAVQAPSVPVIPGRSS